MLDFCEKSKINYLSQKSTEMKTLNLAIENDEDALVVTNLLHEHHFLSRISEKPS